MQNSEFKFHVTDEIRRLGLRGIYCYVTNLSNRLIDPQFEIYRETLAERLKSELFPDFIKKDEILAGFRKLHEEVGRSNRNYPSSAESLVSLSQRKGVIPRVNLLVDIYNCVSLETRLALGAHDVDKIEGSVSLRITDGSENFVSLGSPAPETIGAGEYGYIDDGNSLICRLEYKQCEKTKVTETTTACFYIVQGNQNTPSDYLESAFERLMALTRQFCGGELIKVWREAG